VSWLPPPVPLSPCEEQPAIAVTVRNEIRMAAARAGKSVIGFPFLGEIRIPND
jgi:hypothetical protein